MKIKPKEENQKAELNKIINKRTKKEKRKENTKRIVEAIRKRKSLKRARSADLTGKQQMLALKDKNGKLIKHRDKLTKVTEEYYENMYASKINIPQITKPIDTSDITDITVEEVISALRNMKLGKAPGEDGITTNLLEDAGEILHKGLAQLFTQCIRERKVPKNFCLGIVILLHKKGDKHDLARLHYYLTYINYSQKYSQTD